MTTKYFLDRGGRIILPPGPLRVRAESTEGGARIDLVRSDHTATATVTVRPGQLDIPVIDARSVIATFPVAGAPVFRAGAAVRLFLETAAEPNRADGLQVEVVQQDVAGLYRAELVRLDPSGGGIEVSVHLPDELSPAARTACHLAHEILGGTPGQRVRAETVEVAIDATASMAPRLADGSVATLVDLLTGVVRAVDGEVHRVRIIGPAAVFVPTRPVAELAGRIGARMRELGMGIGRTTGELSADRDREVVLLITDAPPTDTARRGRGLRYLTLTATAGTDFATTTRIDPEQLTALRDIGEPTPTLREIVDRLLATLTVEETRP
ncbi:hypothetical protein [Nocardia sp. alder85J]|uniref:hypothetical protein n=1 Tax=Nocardia sp. alder85J TaxID=2862949 RepID=UPI001CD62196|nr:hypothetical protein [Nocardia sp. alder85J]MCX4090919.1 hypothetical protein [Nocardia sp. alder85J]